MSRFLTAFYAACVAMFFAKGMGIPFWLDGWDYGDQCDIALFTFAAVFQGQAARRALTGEPS